MSKSKSAVHDGIKPTQASSRRAPTSEPAIATAISFVCCGVKRILTITTGKADEGALCSIASARTLRPARAGARKAAADFRHVLIHSTLQATEQLVQVHHNKALSRLDDMLEDAKAFYTKQAAAKGADLPAG